MDEKEDLDLPDPFHDRYPRRNRKSKIEDLSTLEDPEYKYIEEKPATLLYDIDEMLNSPEYEYVDVVKSIPVEEFTLEYIKETGLLTPLLFCDSPDKLGMKMPSPDEFTVDDVLENVGRGRKIEVVEVCTQNGRLMNLSDFIDYYKLVDYFLILNIDLRKPVEEREELLNVLSLEFTSTKLADLVSAPAFVPKIDWIDNVWPKELFKRQENLLTKSAWAHDQDFSTYPKVQRYCLMSVANCFTDFHVDFGGTSVWYHILKGEKVFWLIEPTEENLRLYEEWILGGSNNSCFFGSIVNKCTRLRLKQGSTFIIPSGLFLCFLRIILFLGWIHCVYTPMDSLVFGGNFLHSFSVPMQIRVSRSEDRIKIGSKYRFPHFKQIYWCYLAKVIKLATGRIYHRVPTEEAFIDKEIEFEIKNETEEAGNEQLNHSQSEANSHNIFYDNFGNAEDGSFTYNPIQLKFGNQVEDDFKPSKYYELGFLSLTLFHFNVLDYLISLSPFEINGFHSLIIFMNRLLHSKQPEVIEGITRPAHLIMELKVFLLLLTIKCIFKALLNKITSLDRLNIRKDVYLFQKESKIFGSASTIYDNKNLAHEQTDLSVHIPRKVKGRRSFPKMNKKTLESHPVLVDGLPLPTLAANVDSPGKGYNPISQVVKLGHKPIASAWRRSSDMVRSLPSTSVSILKRKSSDYENQTTIKIESDSNLPTMEDQSSSTTTMVQSSSDIKNLSDNKLNVHRKTKNKFNIPKATKLVEVHDDSPEFAHRSPLQLFSATQEQKVPINNNVKPIETIQKQQNFPPRRAFHHRQRFDSGPRWNNSYSNNSFGYHQQNSRFYFHQQQNDGFFGPPVLRRQPFEQPVRMNNNFIQNDSSSVLERTTVPEQCGHFEKHKDNNVEPKNNQQQLEEPQAMDTAVNELHQISQIMKYPCGAYNYSSAGYVNIAHIPLPPSPKSDFLHTPFEGSGILASDGSSDPFTEVDQLAQLGQMMHE